MQRLHVDDLVGHVLEQDAWEHVNLPAMAETDEVYHLSTGQRVTRAAGTALHPAREPAPVLNTIRETLGAFTFSAQYQQCPVPPEGHLIQWRWFSRYDLPPLGATDDHVVQSWDTANKATELADYSVCTTWLVKGTQYYLLEVFRTKVDFPRLKQAVITQARTHQVNIILIEDTALGTALIQEFRTVPHAGVPVPIGITPRGEKVMRLAAQSTVIEAGQVWLPVRAPWLTAFQAELLAFPHSRYDDQVDSVSQFLTWMADRARNRCYEVRWVTR